MTSYLLAIFEIKEKAARVTSKRAYKEFERWVVNLVQTCNDAAVEKVARIYLFQLQSQYAY